MRKKERDALYYSSKNQGPRHGCGAEGALLGTTSELPLIGITNFWNYHSLMLVIAMLAIPRFLIGISTSWQFPIGITTAS